MARHTIRWGGFGLAVAIVAALSRAQDRPADPPPAPPGDVRSAVADLNLSAEQRATVDPLVANFEVQQRKLRQDLLRQLRATLTPEQYQQLTAEVDRQPPGTRDRSDDEGSMHPPPTTEPAAVLAPGERRLAVRFTGGHDTDDRDHGRPVVLVAAGLGVPADVFRETFSHVHPAAGGQQPSDEQVRQNKIALMRGLSKYGVTNDRLNEVSNYYRYLRSRDRLWRHRDASAYAIMRDGKVTRFTITDAGAGYTTPPTVTVDTLPDLAVTATLTFTTDLARNGSIQSLTASSGRR